MRKIRLPKFKKETIYLFVAGIACVLLLVGTMLLLNSHLKSSTTTDVSKINSKRSQVMVTGEGYHAQRGKKSEQEKKRESRTRSDKSKAWKKAAPNSQNIRQSESKTGRVVKNNDRGKKGNNADKLVKNHTGDEKLKKVKKKGRHTVKRRKKNKNPKAPILTISYENVDRVERDITYINGTLLSFTLSAVSYRGTEIKRGFTVELNGKPMYGDGRKYTATIDSDGGPKLKDGLNEIVASVDYKTNKETIKTTETFRVSMNSEKGRKKEGNVTVSCDCSELGIHSYIDPKDDIPVYEGEKISHVVKRYFYRSGVKFEKDGTEDFGFYLKRINFDIIGRANEDLKKTEEDLDDVKEDLKKAEEGLKKVEKDLKEADKEGDIYKKLQEKYKMLKARCEELEEKYKMLEAKNEKYKTYKKLREEYKTSIYRESIGKYIDSLGEKDFGKDSGWKYKLNGKFPDVGMSGERAYDGDEIVIWYYYPPPPPE